MRQFVLEGTCTRVDKKKQQQKLLEIKTNNGGIAKKVLEVKKNASITTFKFCNLSNRTDLMILSPSRIK